jgi:hypothetical protein
MTQVRHNVTQRNALTLTELLVVISIVVLVVSALLPLVQSVTRGQRVREATRQVNVLLTGAQARAIELGRPVGVWLERAGHEPTDPLNLWYTCHRVYQAEQPEPYTGDIFDARVVLRPTGGPNWSAFFSYPEDPMLQPHCCATLTGARKAGVPLVSMGDLIRFENRGPLFVITGIDESKINFRVDTVEQLASVRKYFHVLPPTEMQNRLAFQPGVRFEVLRRPVKSSGAPVELPRNTGIDLSLSGYGAPYNSPLFVSYNSALPGTIPPSSGFETRFREVNPEYDIVIMFSPGGGIERVHFIAHEEEVFYSLPEHPPFWEIPQGSVHLLLSRDDKIGRDIQGNLNITSDHQMNLAGPLGEANLNDQDNIWLSLSTQTGRALSTPNTSGFANITGASTTALPLAAGTDVRPFVQNARRLAISGQTMGGQ